MQVILAKIIFKANKYIESNEIKPSICYCKDVY